jgi:hypothetical protein
MTIRKGSDFIFLIFALILLYTGIPDLYKAISVTFSGQKISGVIVEKQENVEFAYGISNGCRSTQDVTFAVEYKVHNKLFKASQTSCVKNMHNLHDKVNVIYSKSNPQVMSLEYGIARTWIGATFKMTVGLGGLIHIVYLYKKDIKLWKKKRNRHL